MFFNHTCIIPHNARAIQDTGKVLEDSGRDTEIFSVYFAHPWIFGTHSHDILWYTFLTPNSTADVGYPMEILAEQLEARNLAIQPKKPENGSVQTTITADASEFVHLVDHHAVELTRLFNPFIYETPNIKLAQLAFLNVVSWFDDPGSMVDFNWEWFEGRLADDLTPLCTPFEIREAYGLDKDFDDLDLMADDLRQVRADKFGRVSQGWRTRKSQLQSWLDQNEATLQDYPMYTMLKDIDTWR